jgi:acyl carrier protein
VAYEVIVATIGEILRERGDPIPEIGPETPILATGLDSLDVAALVARLEDRLGFDPFADTPPDEFPRTVGEFASLYAARGAKAGRGT